MINVMYTKYEWYISKLFKIYSYTSLSISKFEKDFDSYDYLIVDKPSLLELNFYLANNHDNKKLIFIIDRYNAKLMSLEYPDHSFIYSWDPNLFDSLKQCFGFESLKREKINISEREKLYLELICFGSNSKEISMDLNITERTVRRIKEKLLNKFGLNSIQQLAIYAIKSGLINIRNT